MLNTVPSSVRGITYPNHVRELLLVGLDEAGVEVKRDGGGFSV